MYLYHTVVLRYLMHTITLFQLAALRCFALPAAAAAAAAEKVPEPDRQRHFCQEGGGKGKDYL